MSNEHASTPGYQTTVEMGLPKKNLKRKYVSRKPTEEPKSTKERQDKFNKDMWIEYVFTCNPRS